MTARTYIAGPMRGYPEHNYPAFERAAHRFRALGHIVISPVEINHGAGDDGTKPPQHYVRNDLRELVECDAIALLPGWEHSTGARCEVAIAVTLGFRFYDAGSGVRIDPPAFVPICGGYERSVAEARAESLDRLVPEIRAWQHTVFPRATPSSVAEHLRREANELCANPTDLEEMADIFMLLVGASDGSDLAAAVRAKFEKNKLRRWGVPDAHGVVEHIEDAGVTA